MVPKPRTDSSCLIYELEISLTDAPTALKVPISFLLSLIRAVRALLIRLPLNVKRSATTAVIISNKILAVAIRYRQYAKVPVVFITDDRSLSNKASGEDIEVWTAKDFLAPPEASFEEDAEPVIVENDPEALAALEEARRKRQEEFLAEKISTKNLKLEQNQISFLQNNGVKTIGDFLNQTEQTFSMMKSKKGMPCIAKYLKTQETWRRKLESL